LATYIPTVWENREVEKPRTYTLQGNGDGTTTLIPAEGNIISEGTPIVAENLNNMESGIENSVQKEGADVILDGQLNLKKHLTMDSIGGRIIFDAGRPETSRIYWNADLVNDYGIYFEVNGALSFIMYDNRVQSNQISSISGPLELIGNDGVIKLKSTGGDWISVVGNQIQNPSGDGNLVISSGDGNGILMLKSPTKAIRMLIGEDGLRVANLAFDGYMPVFASEFTNASKLELKKNIVNFEGNGEEIVNSAIVRNFNYKTEEDFDLPHIGLIVEESPLEVVNPKGEGIDLYAMISVAWKAIQELSAKVTDLENQIQANPTP
jgi:hypothetical protein